MLIAAAAAALLAGGLAVAKADNLLAFARPRPAVDHEAAHDRLIAKAAFTEVLANRAETLGMKAPQNLAPYAPIYPDGLIVYATLAPASDSGGQVQYAAAAPLRATLDFYEDAAALHRMPFTVTSAGPDTVIFQATDGPRSVKARLTRQFENGTQVDLAYN
ncbi:MAG: hypothetical protein ACXU82_01190 [Caulobacteraceae bacterium]